MSGSDSQSCEAIHLAPSPVAGIRLVGVTLSNFNLRDADSIDGEPVAPEQDLLGMI